jgi:hypothetical protein
MRREISVMTACITTPRLPAIINDMAESLAIGAKRAVTSRGDVGRSRWGRRGRERHYDEELQKM